MENQCSPFSWDFFDEDEGIMEDYLWHSLVKKEDELERLKDFLRQAIRERDEAESKCQVIMSDIVTLQKQQQQQQQRQNVEPKSEVDQQQANSSDPRDGQLSPAASSEPLSPAAEKLAEGKPLPEKGRLLQAVMEAGPLLQTLLLAGPLPQWQHPPPRVDSTEIPPVAISCTPRIHHKRGLPPQYYSEDNCVIQSNTKYQKVALY